MFTRRQPLVKVSVSLLGQPVLLIIPKVFNVLAGCVMLPETTVEAALQFAERLRRQVSECVPEIEGEKLTVTVSIGIAGATMRTSGIEALLRRADRALYEAKRSGRNCVVVSRVAQSERVREAAE